MLKDSGNYFHDPDVCEQIGRRLGILLARGNYHGAFDSMRYSIEHELVYQSEVLRDLPLISILDTRTAGAMERHLNAVFLPHLAGITEEDIRAIPNVSDKAVMMIAKALTAIGVPFPVPLDFDFDGELQAGKTEFDDSYTLPQGMLPKGVSLTETARREVQVNQSATLVDMILNSNGDNLREIDEEIKRLQARVAKLKRARKVLAGVCGESGPKSRKAKLGPRVIEFIQSQGKPLTAVEIAAALDVPTQAVQAAVTKSSGLRRLSDNTVDVTD